MSNPIEESGNVNDQGEGQSDNGQQNSGIHPAWNQLLEQLPDELHGVVTPHLREIDQNANSKIQELHSQYDPYKFLVENEVDPEQVEAAIQFVQMFNDDPEDIIRKAIDHYGLNLGQGEPDDDDYDEDDDEDYDDEDDDPRYRKLAERQRTLEENLTAQQQAQLDSEAEEALDEYLDELEEEYGPYDEEYVLALMANGMQGDKAVKQFLNRFPNWQEQFAEEEGEDGSEDQAGQYNQGPQSNGAPIVAGAGGTTGSGLPSNVSKPGSLSRQQTEDLVEQILQRSAQE